MLPKLSQSDHCPILLELSTNMTIPLDFINDCAHGTFNYEHYDINRKIKQPMKLKNINTVNLFNDLENLAIEISTKLSEENYLNNEYLCQQLTDGIYNELFTR